MLGAAIALLSLASAASADSLPAAPPAPGFVLVERAAFAPPQSRGGRGVEISGLVCDAFGRVFATDAGLHRLIRFDGRGRWLGESGALGSGTGLLRRPRAIAALGGLRIAVLDAENRRVVGYDLEGRLEGTLFQLDEPGLEQALGRVEPLALAADRGGALYLVDGEGDRLLAFVFSGRYVRTVAGIGAEVGSFRGLRGVAVRRRGEILTTERTRARVQRLDPGGQALGSWALPVKAGSWPLPIAADDSSQIAVCDPEAGRLWVFDASGRVLAELRELDSPRALAFAPDGTLLVAEVGRVRRFALEPHVLEEPARRE